MTILPLTAILFQILFLTIAIAIESFIFHKKLYLSRRTSIEYAASLNLFSTIIGWAIFFLAHSLLPLGLEQQMVNFMLFGNFVTRLDFPANKVYFYLLALILFTFLMIFSAEQFYLEFLTDFGKLNAKDKPENPVPQNIDFPESHKKQSATISRISGRSRFKIILLANAYSQSAILLISFILERL